MVNHQIRHRDQHKIIPKHHNVSPRTTSRAQPEQSDQSSWASSPGPVSIGTDGVVSYINTAGTRTAAGTLSLAKFPNTEGMMRISSNKWQPSPAAGDPSIGTPGDPTVGLGVTIGGTLEMSNIDLAQEFTQMIVGQRGFQANSRVITSSDEMLQELVNLKR